MSIEGLLQRPPIVDYLLAALHEEGVTRSQIAKTLAIPKSELEQLLFGLAMSSIEGGRTQPSSQSPIKLKRVK
jgi:hypothetical protein